MSFNEQFQRFREIGVTIVNLTKESADLRKSLIAAYEEKFGVIPEKGIGEFLWLNPTTQKYDTLVEISRDAVGKEINILFRHVPTMD